ncbi:lipoprotein [Streptomyces nodosus]|uniref:Lipoprotein n=1 Tax=Streptomyces nodosus TaxID=40318 RepID=A0A0B5DUP5_9ACTN|nr:lipoprotein [Streptomyces nodosus]
MTAACGVLLMSLSACASSPDEEHRRPRGTASSGRAARPPAPAPMADRGRIPGVGERIRRSVPSGSGQALVVYGDGENSPDSTAVFYVKEGSSWVALGRWRGHNGRRGWAADHQENDLRSPVGVFTLSDAGGVLPDPGTRLPYDQGRSYEVPGSWGEAHRRDFYYVIAIDYNRVRGTPPNDPTRPLGQRKGGGIWLHLDHGDGTAACVTLPASGMEYLLRTLDPDRRPVVVMGDRARLMG